ncbi:nudC domain-containing protein 3 [Amyelois transitella]|uniref:nudC domain-containing protein 3 n=1 Tax=Amyelois transitella TaxID=680683 RepID=UPI00067ADCAD|nr:nudC domain-containing protein 3 [Amyelois transitella]XP_013199827.1 nudC domain-containing protein 3 [Amyelois transitella]
MSDSFSKYDDVLTSILVNEKSILGFLSAIFNFLARRTDFYIVPDGPYENIGFPPGVAEELVLKVLRKCDPKNYAGNGARRPEHNSEFNNEIMCSTVGQEVEVVSEDVEDCPENPAEQIIEESPPVSNKTDTPKLFDNEPSQSYVPPVIPTQKNSETYNGAERETYCWAQTIMDLDITVRLPPEIKSSKDLKVTINAGDICVARRNGDVIIKDTLPYKIKAIESFWSISEGKLLIHLEKIQERWWNKFLNSEEAIDLSKIDCSRPLDELPEDHIAKVRELQWNQEQKLKGLPTSDEIRNIEVLKKAWNAPGSPFQGQKFDPSVLSQSLPPLQKE